MGEHFDGEHFDGEHFFRGAFCFGEHFLESIFRGAFGGEHFFGEHLGLHHNLHVCCILDKIRYDN